MKKHKKIIIANWKMKLDVEKSESLADSLKQKLSQTDVMDKKVVLCPSFLAIDGVAKILKNSDIALGAQDVFYEDEGAFTGEISPENLKELNCEYVIVGHSERRAMGESDQLVNKKVKAVLENEMVPIICVGETLEEYQAKKTNQVLARQISNALAGIDNKYFILAYEPVWSISTSGSGQVISPSEAIDKIKILIKNIPKGLDNFDIIYGGSVDDKTVAKFTNDFKGALVGGASLKAEIFFNLIKNT